jgi:S-(hydroxymethyl)glutathione dehydrogenase/alcohol dehydrogenase
MNAMRAAVLVDANEALRVTDVGLDRPGPKEVLVKMAAAGVCHSDWHVMQGDLPVPLPAILGHEGAGVVEEVGEEVTRVKPGDHVVLSWIPSCGHCFYCLKGRPDMCDEAFNIQLSGSLPGNVMRLHWDEGPLHHYLGTSCFAEKTVVPDTGVIPIDPAIALNKAALVGCAVTTGFGAVVHTAHVAPGDSVTVIGCGGVGLNVIQTARLAGADPIIAIDANGKKSELAKTFGATHFIDATQSDDLITPVIDLTKGIGTDFAFEVIGREETIEAAYGMVRKAGMAVIIGVAPPHMDVSFNAFSFPSQSKILTGSWYGQSVPAVDIPRILGLYQRGRLNLDDLVTQSYSLEHINDAFQALIQGTVARGVIEF